MIKRGNYSYAEGLTRKAL